MTLEVQEAAIKEYGNQDFSRIILTGGCSVYLDEQFKIQMGRLNPYEDSTHIRACIHARNTHNTRPQTNQQHVNSNNDDGNNNK